MNRSSKTHGGIAFENRSLRLEPHIPYKRRCRPLKAPLTLVADCWRTMAMEGRFQKRFQPSVLRTWQGSTSLLESKCPANRCVRHSSRACRREAETHGGRNTGGSAGHRNGGAEGPRVHRRRRRQCAKGLRTALAALGLRRCGRGNGGRSAGEICELPAGHADRGRRRSE